VVVVVGVCVSVVFLSVVVVGLSVAVSVGADFVSEVVVGLSVCVSVGLSVCAVSVSAFASEVVGATVGVSVGVSVGDPSEGASVPPAPLSFKGVVTPGSRPGSSGSSSCLGGGGSS
jgi:hypothetical protein